MPNQGRSRCQINQRRSQHRTPGLYRTAAAAGSINISKIKVFQPPFPRSPPLPPLSPSPQPSTRILHLPIMSKKNHRPRTAAVSISPKSKSSRPPFPPLPPPAPAPAPPPAEPDPTAPRPCLDICRCCCVFQKKGGTERGGGGGGRC